MEIAEVMQKLNMVKDKLSLLEIEVSHSVEYVDKIITELSPEYEASRNQDKINEYNFVISFIIENGEEWNQAIQKKFYSNTSDLRRGLSVSRSLKSIGILYTYSKKVDKNSSEWANLIIRKVDIEGLIKDIQTKR